MRILEITIFALTLIALVACLIPSLRKKRGFKYLPFVVLSLIPIHLLVDGYRWQMVPIFVFVFGFVLVQTFQLLRQPEKQFLVGKKLLRRVLIVLSFLVFLLTFIFPALLPVVDLPEPSGPYVVGTTSFRLVDDSREEIFSAALDDVRSVLVTAWYPTDADEDGPVVRYWDEAGITGKAFSQNADMGTFWYSHLSRVKTNSYADPSISSREASYPVIIYSHSFAGLNTENTMLIEDLASHGYIVLSVAHPYEAIVLIYPDGEIVGADLDYIFDLYDAHTETEIRLYKDYENTDDINKKIALVNQILTVDDESTNLLRVRTEDVLFVLDELDHLNTDMVRIFNGKLDLERVGVMGYSFGGATALDVALTDERVKAGINLDGWPYGALFNAPDAAIAQPFMLIRSGDDDELEDIVTNLMLEKMQGPSYLVSVANTDHGNFWDFPLFFKIYQYLGYWQPFEATRLLEINSAYVRGFFDLYLKGDDVDLLSVSAAPYPEVMFEAIIP